MTDSTSHPGWPLQRTLGLWFCAIAAVSCLTIGVLTYYLRAHGMRTFILDELTMVREDKIRDLQQWFRERTHDLELWSQSPGFTRLVDLHAAGEPVSDLEFRSRHLERMRTGYACHAISIFDAGTGNAILTSSGPVHETLPRSVLQRVLEENRVIHTDVFICADHGVPTLLFLGPIHSHSDRTEIRGILAFYMDLEGHFFKDVVHSEQLGQYGEILLVNRDGVSQSPLQYVPKSVGRHTLTAEPARRAAAGLTGSLDAKDYAGTRVLAAHGTIPEIGWGIVVKKDYHESTAIIRQMARQVALVSGGVLVLAFVLSWRATRRVAAPAGEIALVSDRIRGGDLSARAKPAGPLEIQTIARNFNTMVDQLARQLWTGERLGDIFSAASSQNRLAGLLDQVLPRIMETTRSQAAVLYLAAEEEAHRLNCRAVYGMPRDQIADEIHISPPDHLLAHAAVTGQVQMLSGLTDGNDLRIHTQSGTSRPAALMCVPLLHSGRPIAVLGLASLYEYRPEDLDVARTISLSLGQSVAAALVNERNLDITEELRLNNEELNTANEELQSQTEQLQQQSEELHEQTEELAEQRAAVEEADRLKSQFLSNMSHELRTPLNSIMALSQLMLARGTGASPEKEAEYLSIIERNGRHLLNLINDILDLSKIESGRMDILPTQFRPERVVQRALEVARPLADNKGLPIEVTADPVPDLVTDEDKVHQILLNLLSNAVKFTDQGKITVRLSTDRGLVRFAVSDTGIGISDADLPTIFDEFRQVDGSTTRRHEGTGLGLAIGQKLARLLGGEIRVQTRMGQGSTFTLDLPVRPSTAKPTAAPATTSLPGRTRRAKTVLVVDDDPSVRNLLRTYLTESGYDVLVASNGREALALARENRLHAITLDVLMPDMDGWEVIRELKSDSRSEAVPILVISVTEDRATALALGASGFLVKPVDRHILLEELSRVARAGPVNHVLIVDDDAGTRQQLRMMLEGKYAQVSMAAGGDEALRMVRESPPDAIILDLMMPDVDGFTVLDRLRADPATRHLPVLILTAKDLTTMDRQRLRHAVSQIVTKGSMDRSRLLAELDRALQDLEHPADSPSGLVLVVDDDEIAAIQISSALEDAGYQTTVARSGAEALGRAREHAPDAVVLDLMMPGMDGFEVLHQLRSAEQTADTPVLILTAKELTSEDRARLAGDRVRQLIQKGSVDREQLIGVIRELLGGAPDPRPASGTIRRWTRSPASRAGEEADGDGLILVVEDNPDNLFTIRAVLDDLGRRHEHAADGGQAVRLVRELRPALVLMDMQLPVLSGDDAARQIKADPELADIPIIALTAKAMRGDRERILAAGCDDYMAKPLNREELAHMLAKWAP